MDGKTHVDLYLLFPKKQKCLFLKIDTTLPIAEITFDCFENKTKKTLNIDKKEYFVDFKDYKIIKEFNLLLESYSRQISKIICKDRLGLVNFVRLREDLVFGFVPNLINISLNKVYNEDTFFKIKGFSTKENGLFPSDLEKLPKILNSGNFKLHGYSVVNILDYKEYCTYENNVKVGISIKTRLRTKEEEIRFYENGNLEGESTCSTKDVKRIRTYQSGKLIKSQIILKDGRKINCIKCLSYMNTLHFDFFIREGILINKEDQDIVIPFDSFLLPDKSLFPKKIFLNENSFLCNIKSNEHGEIIDCGLIKRSESCVIKYYPFIFNSPDLFSIPELVQTNFKKRFLFKTLKKSMSELDEMIRKEALLSKSKNHSRAFDNSFCFKEVLANSDTLVIKIWNEIITDAHIVKKNSSIVELKLKTKYQDIYYDDIVDILPENLMDLFLKP